MEEFIIIIIIISKLKLVRHDHSERIKFILFIIKYTADTGLY